MAENKNPFVNVDFSKDPELLEDLEHMVKEDDLDRSKFIRKLIRQEKARRQQIAMPGFEQDSHTRTANKRTAKTVAA